MAERRISKLERLPIPDGEGGTFTGCYFIRPGSRSRPWVWFDPHEVPEFEGEVGWFQLERIKGGWKVLHQVPDQRLSPCR